MISLRTDTHLGLQINGAAALVQGIHAWGCGSVWCAQGPNRLTGIAITTHQTRIVDCYLDFNLLDLTDPAEVVVSNTFFLGTRERPPPLSGCSCSRLTAAIGVVVQTLGCWRRTRATGRC